jgi:hypothetical protein
LEKAVARTVPRSRYTSPFSGLAAGANHLPDGVYHDGKLYTEAKDFPELSGTKYIVAFDATTLALVTSEDITGRDPSGLGYDPDGDVIWGMDHTSGPGGPPPAGSG